MATTRDRHLSDKVFYWTLKLFAFGIIGLLGVLLVLLFKLSWPVLKQTGISFYFLNDWNPVTESYGALAFIFGTLVTSILALGLSLPISLGTALLVTEVLPKKFRLSLSFLVEMLAAVPSVVYGLWGLLVVAPFMRVHIQPLLSQSLGFLPFFEGPFLGIGLLTASIILAIMITPTVTTICREIFLTIPHLYKEGALALGATRWEAIYLSVIKSSAPGIFGASILGLARAFGETMAVTMVIGNSPRIVSSLFAPAQTMASLLANEYAEAFSDIHMASLTAICLGLLLISLIVNIFARAMVWKIGKSYKRSKKK